MTNAEFYRDAAKLKAAHKLFGDLYRGSDDKNMKDAAEDPYLFAVKQADFALQPELNEGTLVQVKTNLHGEGMSLKWATVVARTMKCRGYSNPVVNGVRLRFAGGSEYVFDVNGKVLPATTPEDKMNVGEIKSADIPEEFVKLMKSAGCVNLKNCPLKKEGACIDE